MLWQSSIPDIPKGFPFLMEVTDRSLDGFYCDDRKNAQNKQLVVVPIAGSSALQPISTAKKATIVTSSSCHLFFWRYRVHGKWCGEPVQYAPPQDAVHSPVKWIAKTGPYRS